VRFVTAFPSLINSPPMYRCIPQLSELADALAISLPPAVEPLQSLLSVLLRPDAPAVSSVLASGGSPAAVGAAFPGGSHTDRSVAAAAGWHGAAGAPGSYGEASSEDKGEASARSATMMAAAAFAMVQAWNLETAAKQTRHGTARWTRQLL